jgi:hypothetical protein
MNDFCECEYPRKRSSIAIIHKGKYVDSTCSKCKKLIDNLKIS